MRICRTTLWIKKSALFFKVLNLATFGTFGAERCPSGPFRASTKPPPKRVCPAEIESPKGPSAPPHARQPVLQTGEWSCPVGLVLSQRYSSALRRHQQG